MQVNCAVDNYPDLPIVFTWFKNQEKITEPEKYYLKIIQVDTFSSMLVIDSVDSKHTGNYTCVSKNFASTSFSQELIVHGKLTYMSFISTQIDIICKKAQRVAHFCPLSLL